MKKSILKKAEEYVLSLLKKYTPMNNVYHSVDHTLDVVNSCKLIALSEKLSKEEKEILLLAAWFHDLGYIKIIQGHEKISAKYAGSFLKKENYDPAKIKKVKGCILATTVPQTPKNLLEEIICDADLSHFGHKTFNARNNLFREEFEFYFGRALSEIEWLKKSIDFLFHHQFFTEYAQINLGPQKKKNLIKLQRQLQSIRKKNAPKKTTAAVKRRSK